MASLPRVLQPELPRTASMGEASSPCIESRTDGPTLAGVLRRRAAQLEEQRAGPVPALLRLRRRTGAAPAFVLPHGSMD
jgi:hypothetical protein